VISGSPERPATNEYDMKKNLIIGLIVLFVASNIAFLLYFYHTNVREVLVMEEGPLLEVAEKLRAQMIEEYPRLEVEAMPVADEENAYLLIASFKEESVDHGPFDEMGIIELLFMDGEEDAQQWDHDKVKEFILANEKIIEWMEAVAALDKSSILPLRMWPEQSHDPGLIKDSCRLFWIKALFAAKEGDAESALRHLEVVQKVASHLLNIEAPDVLNFLTVAGIDRPMQQVILERVLPTLGRQDDLERWKSVLSAGEYTPEQYARMLRGTWYREAPMWVVAIEYNPWRRGSYQSAMMASARVNHTLIERLEEADLESMLYPEFWEVDISRSELKYNVSYIPGGFQELNIQHSMIHVQTALIQHLYEAVMDLLILEANGEELTADSAAKVTKDPVTGQPFRFDPDERILSWPELPEEIQAIMWRSEEFKYVPLPW